MLKGITFYIKANEKISKKTIF